MADGIHAAPVAGEFLEHAKLEMERADRTSGRIIQLSGEPNYSPDGLSTHLTQNMSGMNLTVFMYAATQIL